jgi:hypothetical protein
MDGADYKRATRLMPYLPKPKEGEGVGTRLKRKIG